MTNLLKTILTTFIIYVMTSCAGSKKVDFNTAYKFSTYNYQKSSAGESLIEKDSHIENSFIATVKPESPAKAETEIKTRIYNKIDVSFQEGDAMEMSELKNRVNQLSLKEKREIRRDIKTELKQLNLEVKNAYSTLDVNKVNEISELTRWSIIIGSVGLVLLILGAIFTVVLTFFGAIFIVGAAVLFILDQV